MFKKLIAAALAALFAAQVAISAYAYDGDIMTIADGIVAWKTADNGSEDMLINDSFLEQAGSTAGDWYPIGLSRLGYEDNYGGYLAVVTDCVEERYAQPGKLSAAKATEWHRISLSVLAAGGDPTCLGEDENGEPIDLIRDGVYDRGKTAPLGRQGINGWIWGLIALDSLRYEVPEDAFYQRDDIITEILSRQLADGGFALTGDTADPDMTAMAVQALAPYYNSEKVYGYSLSQSGEEKRCTVRECVDKAVECLSQLQLGTGDLMSWGTENSESVCQVIVALCCLGIDPFSDERFIKNGNTLMDGLMKYHMEDGGFVHSFVYDPQNPQAQPDVSNTMSGEQALYALAAVYRQKNSMRTLYDFRPEQSEELKSHIKTLSENIEDLSENAGEKEIISLLEDYFSIEPDERSYVYNYAKLYDLAKDKGIDTDGAEKSTEIIFAQDNTPSAQSEEFTEEDKAKADSLPQQLTGEYYVSVTSLLDKLENSPDFEGKEKYLEKLKKAREEISRIRAEVESINNEITDKLYPFEDMGLSDRKTVENIVKRCEKLSDYDRGQIKRYEDVIKTQTKLDNRLRGIIIGCCLGAAAAALAVATIFRIRKRRARAENEMEQLAAMYKDEE